MLLLSQGGRSLVLRRVRFPSSLISPAGTCCSDAICIMMHRETSPSPELPALHQNQPGYSVILVENEPGHMWSPAGCLPSSVGSCMFAPGIVCVCLFVPSPLFCLRPWPFCMPNPQRPRMILDRRKLCFNYFRVSLSNSSSSNTK